VTPVYCVARTGYRLPPPHAEAAYWAVATRTPWRGARWDSSGDYDPTMTTIDRLPFTGDVEADRLLVSDPLALLIGFVLDQQVPLQKAFSGPLELSRRVGGLDARTIASMDPERLDEVFRERPALHRFPGNMARRTQELCAAIVERYDGDTARIWTEAVDGRDLHERLLALPGIGPMKAGTLVAILGKQLAVAPAGWEAFAPDHMTLGDVDSADKLATYQAGKRAKKAELRAQEQKP
jgi:uncharacterized HhH-GPD family protein